jgi:hypothetical protein
MNKKQNPQKTCLKIQGSKSRKYCNLFLFLSEITIFALSVSVSLSFYCLVAFDDFFLGLRQKERERERERERRER